MNLRCCATFVAAEAATHSVLVEPDAVVVCVSLLQAVTLSEEVKKHLVIDLCFLSSEPQLAPTMPASLGWYMLTVSSPTASGSGAGS